MNQRKFRDVSGLFPTGVTVVTTNNRHGAPVGMTANSFTSLSLEPPLILINIGKNASLFDDFMDSNHLAVNLLSQEQKVLSKTFSKKGIDRFNNVSYTVDKTGSPILNDTLGYFDCTIKERVESGDHVILIGEVQSGEVRDGDPLVFYRGKYTEIVHNSN